jgi:hypothetical protein
VVEPVPRPGGRLRLLAIDPLGVVHVEAEEVDQLAGAVDLRLERRLALAQHGGRVDQLAVRRGEELGGLEEHGGPVLEAPVAPVPLRLHRRLHRRRDRGAVGLVHPRQDPVMAMRGDHVVGGARPDLPAAHHGGDLDRLRADRAQRCLEGRALRGAGRVAQNRFVAGMGNVGDAAHR